MVAYRIPETLPQEVLTKMYAPPKPDYEVITPEKMATFDAFLFGIPTRYGNFPAQWKVRLPSRSLTRIF
jgi:NAD(P)H dehydrogenase (quinone)